jgi:hypothetical protein
VRTDEPRAARDENRALRTSYRRLIAIHHAFSKNSKSE